MDGSIYYTGSAFVCRSIPSVTLSNPSRRFTEYAAPPDGVQNAPLVFVGYGVTAPERQWDDFKGLDLKGKPAVVPINDPGVETGERSERPKQTVLYAAHRDHLGIGARPWQAARAEAQRGIFARHCRRKRLAWLRVLRRQLLYAVGRELSDATAWPNWSQDSEFRTVRDRSAARRR